MICMLKYHLKAWCLVIYTPFYEATVYCNTRYYFFKAFIVTNSDQLLFFRREFMNPYKLHNHKFMNFFLLLYVYYLVLQYTIV